MEHQRQQRVERLAATCRQLAPAQRQVFLDQACAGDPLLRRQVEDLVAAGDTGASGPLDRSSDREPLASDPPTIPMEQAPRDPQVGRRIGHYRVQHLLGRGGMGAVYLATRADDEFQQQVALKLLRPESDSEELVRRFRTERQILAALDHPNIAKLLDGGTTPDGLPYFAMEYVEGQPIDRFCASRRLSVVQRLELFRTVCAAVGFAHQNLVVHRDLKPGNILVTAEGKVKLLDFGIAKLLNPLLGVRSAAGTAVGTRLLTPDFASPEQVMGEPVSTASDVYALGVLLYLLLTGRSPHATPESTPMQVLRAICEEQPVPPSVAVVEAGDAPGLDELERRRRRRALAGDLDAIVLKALAKAPQERYSSALQLAEDLGNYLQHLPVTAAGASFAYRMGKFVRRHRLGVLVASLFVLALATFGVVMAVQRQAVARERDRAEAERQRAEQVTDLLTELFKTSDPLEAPGETVTAREVLDRAAVRLDSELADQPELQARLQQTVGTIFRNLGLYDRASPLLEKALATQRRLHGESDPAVADALAELGVLRNEQGLYDEAAALSTQALDLRRRLLAADDPAVADSLHQLAVVRLQQGQLEAAEQHFREALELRRARFGGQHPEVAASLSDLAALLFTRGQQEGSQALVAEAEELFREALAMRRELLGPLHPQLAETVHNLAVLKQSQGELEEARALFEEALAMKRQLLPADHPELAASLNSLAGVLNAQGQSSRAEPLAREALGILQRSLPEGDWRTHMVASVLGHTLLEQGRYAEAEPLLLDSYQGLAAQLGPDHPATRRVRERLASLYQAWGKPEQAAQYQAAGPAS